MRRRHDSSRIHPRKLGWTTWAGHDDEVVPCSPLLSLVPRPGVALAPSAKDALASLVSDPAEVVQQVGEPDALHYRTAVGTDLRVGSLPCAPNSVNPRGLRR
jgi:hypothetical protein